MCQNIIMRVVYGAWIKSYYVSCPKTYSRFGYVSKTTAPSWQAAGSARICEMGLLPTGPCYIADFVFSQRVLQLSLVQFFPDCGQTCEQCTSGQDLGWIHSWKTWFVKWVPNELINHFDLPSLVQLSRGGNSSPIMVKLSRDVPRVKISAKFIYGRPSLKFVHGERAGVFSEHRHSNCTCFHWSFSPLSGHPIDGYCKE